MRKLKLYLDTSVINFLFADDAPEKKEITIDFFENYVKRNIYDVFISDVVIREINKTSNEKKREQLLNVIKTYQLQILDIEGNLSEIESLSSHYIQNKIIPEGKLEDALHIAISTVFDMDFLLSWNYKHLANFNNERKVLSINIIEGYSKDLKLTTPMEVLHDED